VAESSGGKIPRPCAGLPRLKPLPFVLRKTAAESEGEGESRDLGRSLIQVFLEVLDSCPTAEKLPTAGSWFILPRMDDKHRKAEKETSLYTDKEAVSGLKEKLPAIDTFPNQFPDYEITIEVPEFTSVCPRTGLPDFGVLTIRYVPDKLCLELKSLKMYLLAYRNLGIFYENAVNRILEDIIGACRPLRASVKGEFNPRGGMRSKVEVCFPREKGKGQGSS